MIKLSVRQRQIYDIIDKYFAKHGFCPSLSDIAQLAGLHESTVATYVATLKQKGAVKNEYRVARSLRTIPLDNIGEKPVAVRNEIKDSEKNNVQICIGLNLQTEEKRRPLIKMGVDTSGRML